MRAKIDRAVTDGRTMRVSIFIDAEGRGFDAESINRAFESFCDRLRVPAENRERPTWWPASPHPDPERAEP